MFTSYCFVNQEEYGDIHATIKDLEKNVLRLVANRINSMISILFNCSSVIAELDILLSWSILCMECNFIRPVITSENIIHVVVCLLLLS